VRTGTTASRFLPHLQQFVTMFFTFTMVGYFKNFSDTFHLTTNPSIDFRNVSQVLILISFIVTLYWIVTAWLGYNMLIERHPYTMDLGHFFFDVARFSLLNFIMSFAFLAGSITSFQVYIFALALWHAMMIGWYIVQAGNATNSAAKGEARKDMASHGVRFSTYFILGLIYYFAVATQPDQPNAQLYRCVIAGAVFLITIVWNSRRIVEIRARGLADMLPAAAS
jgi:hypothetical protein